MQIIKIMVLLEGVNLFLLLYFYTYLTFYRVRMLKQIKSKSNNVYKKILGNSSKSWIERKYYSPMDIPIVLALDKAIRTGELNSFVCVNEINKYKRYRLGSKLAIIFLAGNFILIFFLLVYIYK